jgi:hypothetical protein
MVYSGIYRCSGCSLTFTDPSTWREAPDTVDPSSVAAGTPPAVALLSDMTADGPKSAGPQQASVGVER